MRGKKWMHYFLTTAHKQRRNITFVTIISAASRLNAQLAWLLISPLCDLRGHALIFSCCKKNEKKAGTASEDCDRIEEGNPHQCTPLLVCGYTWKCVAVSLCRGIFELLHRTPWEAIFCHKCALIFQLRGQVCYIHWQVNFTSLDKV